MFTHLRTGVDMVRTGGIPRVDPYSFTAHGRPWVVQSWLAEATYGVLNRVGGLRLVVLEQGVLTAVLALLTARLARAGTPVRTAAAAVVALGAGVALWSPRPLLFGLVCLALLVTVVEQDRSPLWLVPVAWIWVNSHGSFFLGLGWLAAVVVGEALDRRALPRAQLRHLAWFTGGVLSGAINPLGPRLLSFPLTVGAKSEVFKRVVEWHSPNFQTAEALFSLAFLAVALVVLLRARPPWRDVLPAVAFLVLGLLALRNLPAAAVVVAPALGRALRPASDVDPGHGVSPAFAFAVGLLALVFVGLAVRAEPVLATAYPEDAVASMRRQGLFDPPHRVAEQDFVGNYLELRYGRRVPVFIDDRVDMFPVRVSDDYYSLLTAAPDALAVLDRDGIDVVLWEERRPLVLLLRTTGTWHEVYHQGAWVALRRDGPAPFR